MSTKKEELAALEVLTKPITEQAIEQARIHGSTHFLNGLAHDFNHDDMIEDVVIAPPQPTPGMFYGFVGELAAIAAKGTEINPVAAATVFLSFLGANVGRDTFLFINNTYHHPRLFTLHIGRSGRGGKGDSQSLTKRIRQRIEELDGGLLGQTYTGGLSSREGLAALIHDGYGESPAIIDKRLWLIESEFSNVLHQSKREGNTLSSALREVWDGGDIKPATKSKPVGVTNPHIGIHANITPLELNGLLSSREMSNGFANRFLMIFSENVGYVPFPSPTPQRLVEELADKTIDIIHYAKGGYPNRINGLEMNLSQAAKALYEEVYRELRQPLDGDFITAILERRAPYALRLAMLFALTDQTRVIEACHLHAALEWVNYAVNTVKFVFADKANNQQQAETRNNAARIMAFLRLRPNGAGMRDLINECFQKNGSSEKINSALSYLLAENPPRIEQIIDSSKGRIGRKKHTYQIKTGTDKTDKFQSHATQGLEGDLQVRTNYGQLRTNSTKQQENLNCPLIVRNEENDLNPDTARPANLSVLSVPNIFSTDQKPPPKQQKRHRKAPEQKGAM